MFALKQNNIMHLNYPVGNYIEDFLRKKGSNSINTLKTYQSALNKIFKDIIGHNDYCNITTKNIIYDLNIDNVLKYFDMLSEEEKSDGSPKYSNQTLNNRQSAFKELIKYLKLRKVIDYDLDDLQLLESYKNTAMEIEMIPFQLAMDYIEYFSKTDNGLEKSLIIKLAIETALRATELISLEWSNFIVVEDGVIMKSHGYNKGKGNKEWIDKISLEFYNELLKLKVGGREKVFTLTYKQLYTMMEEGNREINNTELSYTFHSFKKLSVTMCYINNGNCIHSAMKKARHNNVNTTMRYLRLTDLNISGIISAQMTVEDELYETVSHELLLECLSEMRTEMLVVLNNKIKNKLK